MRGIRYFFTAILSTLTLCFLVIHLSSDSTISLPAINYDILSVSVSNLIVESVASEEVNDIVKSTVGIRIYTPEGRDIVIGSGVILKNEKVGLIVLTARHVSLAIVGDEPRACSISTKSCVPLPPDFLVTVGEDMHPSTDWAIYKIPKLPDGALAAKISSKNISIGSSIWISGIPWGRIPWISSGNVAWQWKDNGAPLMGITGYAAPGSSGGGAFNEEGELIGIVIAIIQSRGVLQTSQILVVPIRNIWVLSN